MKKLLVVAGLVTTMVAGVMSMASAYTIMGGLSEAYNGGNFRITTANDNAWTTALNNAMSDDGYLVVIRDATTPLTWENIYKNANDSSAPRSWTFAVFVESATANPTASISIWGANAAQIADIVGEEWALSIWDDQISDWILLDSNMWSDQTSAANPFVSYNFTDTSGMVGPENAVVLKLEQVPEPASVVALLTGVVGLGGFAIRRRK